MSDHSQECRVHLSGQAIEIESAGRTSGVSWSRPAATIVSCVPR